MDDTINKLTFEVVSYVFQHVGPRGNWYDVSKWNVNPLEDENLDGDFKIVLTDNTPNDKPWRLIHRVSHETILNLHDPEHEN